MSTEAIYDFVSPLSGGRWDSQKHIIYSEILNRVSKLGGSENRLAVQEIAMECKTAYHEAGGKDFHYIPCLNQRDDWIAALAGVADRHLAGWPLQSQANLGAAARARALGATNA